ncbi:MAG: hypothetical protein AABW59_03925 [archaeon]
MTQKEEVRDKKQVFIGSAVTHVPDVFFEEYKELIVELSKLLETKYLCKAKHSLKKDDSRLSYIEKHKTAADCYKKCVEDIKASKLMIAEISFPSIGLGQEIEIASQNKIPIIVLFKDYFGREPQGELIVSRMALGNPLVVHQIKYKTTKEAIGELESILESRPHYLQ